MVKEELDVFLSSDQQEFSRLRKQLSKEICHLPFLTCTLLEERGADSVSVLDSSLSAVRNCDIYVGVFGHDYSEITLREFQEAFNLGKPCLTYIKKMRERDEKLESFINSILKNEFKYFPFKTYKELTQQLKNDLSKFILETLEIGIRILNTQGRLVFLGVSNPKRCESTLHYFKELEIIGSNAYGVETYQEESKHAIAFFLRFLDQGIIETSQFLTHTYKLEDYQEAFNTLSNKNTTEAIKIAFKF